MTPNFLKFVVVCTILSNNINKLTLAYRISLIRSFLPFEKGHSQSSSTPSTIPSRYSLLMEDVKLFKLLRSVIKDENVEALMA